MAVEIILRKISVRYDGYAEDHWLLFESGSLSRPTFVLTKFEMGRLVKQYQEIERGEGGAKQEEDTN